MLSALRATFVNLVSPQSTFKTGSDYMSSAKDMIYPINYGYIEEVIAGDGEEQDAYIIGIDTPLTIFSGIVIAIIHRKNDVEEKWVVAPRNMRFSEKEIIKATEFTGKYFEIEIQMK